MEDCKCPIWGTSAKIFPFWGEPNPYEYESARVAGTYKVTGTAKALLTFLINPEKAKLTTWLVNQRLLGNPCPTVTEKTLDEIKTQNFLRNSERMDRFFTYLDVSHYRLGNSIFPKDLDLEDYHYQGRTSYSFTSDNEISAIKAYTECVDEYEIWQVKDYLEASGYIKDVWDEHESSSSWSILTPLGLKKLDELSNSNANSKQAFVAMWFDASVNHIYEEAIAPAIREAGFEPIRIDRKEHNNKIDDEIVAELRRSRFVIADFTSAKHEREGRPEAIARGGVYYEAGFAHGMNIPVIWTCREDMIGLVHFDTRQYNHIDWKDAADLKKRLYDRIRATIT